MMGDKVTKLQIMILKARKTQIAESPLKLYTNKKTPHCTINTFTHKSPDKHSAFLITRYDTSHHSIYTTQKHRF